MPRPRDRQIVLVHGDGRGRKAAFLDAYNVQVVFPGVLLKKPYATGSVQACKSLLVFLGVECTEYIAGRGIDGERWWGRWSGGGWTGATGVGRRR